MDAARVNVTVDEDHLETIDEVADELRARGMEVDEVLVSIGIVTGTAEDPDALRRVPGIQSVDLEEERGVAPPDWEIQ